MAQKKTIVIEAKDNTKGAFNKVKKNLKQTDVAVNKTKRSFDSLRAGIKGAIGVLTIGAFVRATKSTLDLADALGKTSARLGLTTEALQTLRFAATQSGMTTEMLEMSMQRFTRRISEANNGTGVLKDTFKQLGMSLKDSNGNFKNAETLLGEVSDKLALIPDQGRRVELAFKMFDSEGVKMVNMLQGGKKGFDELRQSLIDTGAIMTDDFIKNSEVANDALDKLTVSIKAGFATAISGMAPLLTDVASGLTDFIAVSREYPVLTKLAGAITAVGLSLALLGGPITIALTAVSGLIAGGAWLNSYFKDQKKLAEDASTGVDKVASSYNKAKVNLISMSKAVQKDTYDMNSENRRQQAQLSQFMINDAKEKALKEMEISQLMYTKKLDHAVAYHAILRTLRIKELQESNDALAIQRTAHADWMDQKEAFADAGMESLQEEHERQKALVDQAYLGEVKNKEAHQSNMLLIDQRYDKAVQDLYTQRSAVIAGQASMLAQELNKQGVMGFDTMKAFAIAEASINAYVAASKAWAQGGAFGAISAGLTLAMAMVQVDNIRKSKPPKRELGGSVSKGKSFLVGERGPELFTPNQSGGITPNNQLGSANVTFNIQANDARGFDQLLQARRGMIVGMINKAMRNNAQKGLM